MTTAQSPSITAPLLSWFDHHGRHDLPWQQSVNPYRVWVSEIMLQQTQVQTVIPYYERFMARFPTLSDLANADLDDVLSHWAGLGYYARARNLHRAASQVCHKQGGELPRTLDALVDLPGIGRSTAGAILALAYDQRHPILDGNVKRVLSRYHAVEGWSGSSAVQRQLWALAELHTPDKRVGAYTQAIMDLGATLCTRGRPKCGDCPLHNGCRAHIEGRVGELPHPRPKKARPQRRTHLLLVHDPMGRVLMVKRPPTGIWGGLWSLPECEDEAGLNSVFNQLGISSGTQEQWPVVSHIFTHFELLATPLLFKVSNIEHQIAEADDREWVCLKEHTRRGSPALIKRLLERLEKSLDQELAS